MVSKELRSRVEARLAALDIKPITLAVERGLERTFVNDILSGRKRGVQRKNLNALADALECDPEYLLGHQDQPRRNGTPEGLEVRGVCETGVWRETEPPQSIAPLLPDPRFRDIPQWAYEVRGDGAASVGLTEGSLVVVLDASAVNGGAPRGAHIVVARRRRGGQVETWIREAVVSGRRMRLVAPSARPYPDIDLEGDEVEIVGLVDRAVRLFI